MSAAPALGVDLGALADTLANATTYPDAIGVLLGDVDTRLWVEEHLELRGDAQHPLHGARSEREAREHDRSAARTSRPALRERDVVESRRGTSRQARTRADSVCNDLADLRTRTAFKYNFYKATLGALFVGDVAGGTTAMYNYGDPVVLAVLQMLSLGAAIVTCTALGAKVKDRELAKDRCKMRGKRTKRLRRGYPQLFVEPEELPTATKAIYGLGAFIGLSSALGLFSFRYSDDPVAATAYLFFALAVAAGSWVAAWAAADPVDDLIRNAERDLHQSQKEYTEAPLEQDSTNADAIKAADGIRKESWMEGLAAELELLAAGKLVKHHVPSLTGHGYQTRKPAVVPPTPAASGGSTGDTGPTAPAAPVGPEPKTEDDLEVIDVEKPAKSSILTKDLAAFQPRTPGSNGDKNHRNGATP